MQSGHCCSNGGPGLWQVAVRLVAVDDVQAAPVPRARKMQDRRARANHVGRRHAAWASDRTGHRARRNCDHGHDRPQPMVCRGSATARIHAPTSVLPFAGSFEVAVPVVSHAQDQSTGDNSRPRDAGRAPANRPANPSVRVGPMSNAPSSSAVPTGLMRSSRETCSSGTPAGTNWPTPRSTRMRMRQDFARYNN
jgi:hypothetical protein